MRVLIIHPSDELYGADRVLLESVRALTAAGNDVTVWLPQDVFYPERKLSLLLRESCSVVWHDLPILRRDYTKSLTGLLALAFRFCKMFTHVSDLRRFDLVYLNTSATLPMAALAQLARRPVLLHQHEILGRQDKLFLFPFLYLIDSVITVSQSTKSSLPLPLSGRARVIYNGFPALVPDVTSEGKKGEGPVTFLVASRWNHWKGHKNLLTAWGKVQRTDIRLIILGSLPPSGQGVDVARIVENLPNRGTVELVGEVDDAAPFILRADAVLVPSELPDPLPTIAIEAQRLGRAVIANAVGGLPEIVNTNTGVLLEGSLETWVSALENLSRAELAAMGAAAMVEADERWAASRYHREIVEAVASWDRNSSIDPS